MNSAVSKVQPSYLKKITLLIDCAGSLLLHGLVSICCKWRVISFQCEGFSLKWLLLLWSMGSKAHGLQ